MKKEEIIQQLNEITKEAAKKRLIELSNYYKEDFKKILKDAKSLNAYNKIIGLGSAMVYFASKESNKGCDYMEIYISFNRNQQKQVNELKEQYINILLDEGINPEMAELSVDNLVHDLIFDNYDELEQIEEWIREELEKI